MALHSHDTFQGGRVLLDNNEFRDCVFADCELVFAGGGPVALSGNVFKNVKWSFEGAAARTLQFLTAMYHGAGPGGRELVENTFEAIRRGGKA